MTCTGLSGTIDNIMSTKVVSLGAGVSPFSIALVSTPLPGWKNVPSARPSQAAICPVMTNNIIARPPTLPSFLRSPNAATPATSEKKISGTTSILIDLMKKSPIHLIASASGPHISPVITPRISAAITLCQSGILNQNASMRLSPMIIPAHAYPEQEGAASP